MKKLTSKARSSSKTAVSKVAKEQSVDLDLLERVSSFMRENGIVELEVRSGGSEIKLRRAASNGNGSGGVPPFAYSLGAMPVPAAAPVVAAPAAEAKPAPAPAPEKKYHVVSSPFVGTFYRASGPNQEPFVEVGKIVNPGNTLCIIEAMKLMNEIESDAKGRVVRVVVQNGTPVEYGDPLFEIEPL